MTLEEFALPTCPMYVNILCYNYRFFSSYFRYPFLILNTPTKRFANGYNFKAFFCWYFQYVQAFGNVRR